MSSAGHPHAGVPTEPPARAASEAPAGVPRPRFRRLTDAFALLCVAGAALAVSLAAAPSIARELGWTRASLSRRAWTPPSTGAAPSRNDPIFVDPDVFEPAGRPRAQAPAAGADDDDDLDRAAPARFAVAVRDVAVHASADDHSRSLAQVARGELLLVIREEGEWALVAHIADDGGTTGWVRSGDLAIR